MDINMCPKCKKIIILATSHDVCWCGLGPEGLFDMGRSCGNCAVGFLARCLICRGCSRKPGGFRDNWRPGRG